MTTKPTNPKDSMGMKKPPLSVIPCAPLFEVGAAMMEGHLKGYRRHNYRVSGVRMSIYYDAAMRHLMAWWEGEDLDPDSGISHISKAIAGLIVLRDSMINNMATDDRPPRPNPQWLENVQEKVSEILEKYPDDVEPYTDIANGSARGMNGPPAFTEEGVSKQAPAPIHTYATPRATPMEEAKPGYVPAYDRMKSVAEKRGGIPDDDLHDPV